MTMKCDDCPVKDGPCISERPGWEFACKLAVSSDVERRWVVDRSEVENKKAEYPPIAEQAVNFLKSAVAYVASGCATVDQAEYDRRRAVCSTCPNLDPDQNRCRACGCAMSVKPWGLAMGCPEGKW
jgi:hypothetical protein